MNAHRRVLVVGLGYAGLPLAVRAAECGYVVQGIDSDAGRVRALMDGRSPLEDISDERLQAVVGSGSFRVHAAQGPDSFVFPFDCAVIAVPTPLAHGVPDRSHLEEAARLIGRNLRRGSTVIVESSSFPGTTEGLVANAIREESAFFPGDDYHLGFSPERIDPGDTMRTLIATPKLVSGTDAAATASVKEFYDRLIDETVVVSSPAVAEFAKIFESIFSQVNIALVNEMAVVAHEFNIDIWEVLDAAGTKPHGFLRHAPGPGVGGHCLPVSPAYLSWLVDSDLGVPLRLSELAREINESMPAYVVERARRLLPGGLMDANVLILGAAYKAGTSVIRDAPALEIVELLRRKGAIVTISDPHVREWEATAVLPAESVLSHLGDFSLVIVVTDHDEFDYAKIAGAATLVLDCRRRMTPSKTVSSL